MLGLAAGLLCASQAVYPNNEPNAAYLAKYIAPVKNFVVAHMVEGLHEEKCSRGTYKTHKGVAESKGLVQDEDYKCTQCPPGKYQFVRDAQYCFHCPAAAYTDNEGQSKCKSCPEGEIAFETRTHAFEMNNGMLVI